MNWLNNPWFVGVTASILGGLVITWLSRYVLGKRENREYVQRVQSANHDVIYQVRPGISEGVIPTVPVLNALISATARKYGVSEADLFGPRQLAEELIREVMDSSFISASKKADYCAQLVTISTPPQPPPQPVASLSMRLAGSQLADYRRRTSMLVSTMLGLVTTMMTLLFTVVQMRDRLLSSPLDILMPTVAIALSVVVSSFTYLLYKRTINKRTALESPENPKEEGPSPSRPDV